MKITSINSPLTKHEQYDTMDGKIPPLYSVTKISQGVKNPNRANIFIDGKYSFSLDIAQLADFKLKIGQDLTPSQLADLQHASDFGKLYQRTLEWVLTRPRSVQETRDYLRRKQFARGSCYEKQSSEVLDRLISKSYLDDAKFAEFWVNNRFVNKGASRRRLEQELAKKGVARPIVLVTLAATDRTDAAEISKIIAKKGAKYAANPQKFIQYLVAQGFDYESAKTAVQQTDSQNSA